MIRRLPWTFLCLALLGLAALLPRSASADVIDYDPRSDQVPQILSPEDMDRYQALRGAPVRRHGVLDVSPGGQHAVLSMGGNLEVYDVASRARVSTISLAGLGLSSGLHWTSPTRALALTAQSFNDRRTPWRYYRSDFDIAAGTMVTQSIQIDDKVLRGATLNAVLSGGTPAETPDGKRWIFGLGQPGGGLLDDLTVEVERPSYDGRTEEELALLGEQQEPYVILQQAITLLAVSIDDGSVIEVATVPAGTNPNVALGTAAMRPGHAEAAFVTYVNLPWAGEVINGRSNRGGGMPNSYWNVQENLGRIPESENFHITQTQLHIVDLGSGDETIVENADHTPGKFSGIVWTADGEHLFVEVATPSILAGREHPIYEYSAGVALQRYTPAGAYQDTWARVGMDASSTAFFPTEGTKALVLYGMNTTRHLAIVDLADAAAEPEPVYQGDDMLLGFAYRDGSLAAGLTSAVDPGETWLGKQPAGGGAAELAVLTDLNAAARAVSHIAYAPFSYTSSAGYALGGIYIYPAEWGGPPSEPKPAVVWQQGGPGGQIYNMWGTSVESPYSLLPNFGIPVIMVNGAGRTSNGQQFYSDMADGTNFGQRDIRDVKEAVDHLIGLGWVKADAVGVTGCSYGGYFTLQSLVTYPNTYAAGNSQCSLNDMFYEFNFGWSPFLAYLLGDTPTGNPEEYVKDSPTYNANKIEVPLLQFHGTSDFLFFEQITNIHDQVAMNGVASRFFRPIGYGHGIGGIGGVPNAGADGQKFAFQLQLDWFRTHLGVQSALAFDDAAVAAYRYGRWLNGVEMGRSPVPGPVAPEVR
ncbi:MAG: prolyl oligopeptidase family serine peptidase [Caldilineae bacterium]|nr:prolyl oligopeptidase family serine peptidase [Chloroflexota bacterium]MCB9175955.1 prolyl oligopeptidase family serine peptidase [Caldilineae bacterium]